MSFATNSDLVTYYPTAMDHGIADWTTDLAEAQSDVETLIKTRWFNIEFGGSRSSIATVGYPIFDTSKLTEAQWTRATVYRALSCYILPKLSTFRPEGDAFREQLAFFQNRFDEEMNLQLGSGVEYDVSGDGTVTPGEKFAMAQDRLYR